MSEKKYPDEIYPGAVEIFGAKVAKAASTADLEKAYDIGLAHGKEQSESLAGFSNLTQAIQDGARIDWEKLDGRKAKCVHPELGTLTHTMVRDTDSSETSSDGWCHINETITGWISIFTLAWRGSYGWSLWIEGDIPLKLPTADTLEPGSVFVGKNGRITKPTEFVVAHSPYADKAVAYPIGVLDGDCFYASGVDVIEVKSGGFKEGQ